MNSTSKILSGNSQQSNQTQPPKPLDSTNKSQMAGQESKTTDTQKSQNKQRRSKQRRNRQAKKLKTNTQKVSQNSVKQSLEDQKNLEAKKGNHIQKADQKRPGFMDLFDPWHFTGVQLVTQDTNQRRFVDTSQWMKMSQAERDKARQKAIKNLSVNMPKSFQSQEQYLQKLIEQVEVEGEVERLKVESYCESQIEYEIVEHTKIVMWLSLNLPESTDLKVIRDGALLKVLIERFDDCKPYSAIGQIEKVVYQPKQRRNYARVQIDIRDPLTKLLTQQIPAKSEVHMYERVLSFGVCFDEQQIKSTIKQLMQSFAHEGSQHRKIIQSQLWSAKKSSDYCQEFPFQPSVGMQDGFNASQVAAITEAMKSRLTLIQGPPGTGKTKVIAGIVANMLRLRRTERILVCTTMNYTADLLAETIYKVDDIKHSVLRTCSYRRENIFKVKFDELEEYSILHKCIFDVQAQDAFTKEEIDAVDFLSSYESKLDKARWLINYYFGATNFKKDIYLQRLLDSDGWVSIDEFQDFTKFGSLGVLSKDVYEVIQDSGVVESRQVGYQYQVRRRLKQQQLQQFLGFSGTAIKDMTKQQFQKFLQHKQKFEQKVTKDYQIIVTTCGCAANQLIKDLKIKTVVIDEATQVKEHESFLATINAEQIILVGDQKQLGPTLEYDIKGPTSMFQRLVEAKYKHSFLDTQYRMHPELLKVPNRLFYDNKIKNGYKPIGGKSFLGVKSPFLFIDVKNGREYFKGTSIINQQEIQVLEDFLLLVLGHFENDTQQKFHSGDIFAITPYNAQKHAIAEQLQRHGLSEQVISVDGSQGREYDVVLISTVRTQKGEFLREYNRINVALTRAKHGLVIIGNARALRKEKNWERLLQIHNANVVDGFEGAKRWIEAQKSLQNPEKKAKSSKRRR